MRFRSTLLARTNALFCSFTVARPLSTPVSAAADDPIPEPHTATPPVNPWPQFLYPKLLASMIARQQSLDLALQIFDYAGKYHPGFSHNYHTYLSIIHKLSRARSFETVESLLSRLQESRIKCREDIFISVIRGYGLAGKSELALETFVRMDGFEVKRSVRSLNTLLNVFVQNKRYDLVHSMFKECKDKYGFLPNIVTCNILIKALCKKNDIEVALKVLDEMPAMGMIPNVVTYTTVLSGYVLRGDMLKAKKVLGELFDKGWLPDATTYTILIDGYVKLGKLNEAIKVMDDMEEYGVEPNEVTYGVMIKAYCQERKAGEAHNLMVDMLERKYLPSSNLCCKVIDVLCEEGKVEDACELWRRMLKNNCLLDNAIISTLVYWLCKEGKIWEARKLFGELEQASVPSLLTYNTLICGMCERGELNEAGRLRDEMVQKGCKPNTLTYNVLIKGFCKVGNPKEGIRILEEMLGNRCLPNKTTYTMLINGLHELRMEGEVEKVVSMAMASGRVDTDCWDLFLNQVVTNLDGGTATVDALLMDDAMYSSVLG